MLVTCRNSINTPFGLTAGTVWFTIIIKLKIIIDDVLGALTLRYTGCYNKLINPPGVVYNIKEYSFYSIHIAFYKITSLRNVVPQIDTNVVPLVVWQSSGVSV